jgi:hypothetical protein
VPSGQDGETGREIPLLSLSRDGERKLEVTGPGCQEKPLSDEMVLPVPQTDTGRWVENTKGIERTFVKELGKITP